MPRSAPRLAPITVRNLPPRVARAVREKARREGLSLNKAVVQLLENATDTRPDPKPVLHHDLDHFFGRATKREADRLDEAIKEQRSIDPDMWR